MFGNLGIVLYSQWLFLAIKVKELPPVFSSGLVKAIEKFVLFMNGCSKFLAFVTFLSCKHVMVDKLNSIFHLIVRF